MHAFLIRIIQICHIQLLCQQLSTANFFLRNHRMETESCTLHDAGDYTFVPEGYSQSLCCKIHIIGITFFSQWKD